MVVAVDDADAALADEFEDREEQADDLRLASAFEKRAEGAGRLLVARAETLQLIDHVGGVKLDGGLVGFDAVRAEPPELHGLDDALERAHEFEHVEVVHVEGVLPADSVHQRGAVGVGAAGGVAPRPLVEAVLELVASLAERAVFEKLAQQLRRRIARVELFVELRPRGVVVGLGVHVPALHLDERGRDHQKLRRLVHVDLVETLDVGEKLVGDGRQGDLGDVELGAADELEEQVERPLEGVEHHRVVAAVHAWSSLARPVPGAHCTLRAMMSPSRKPDAGRAHTATDLDLIRSIVHAEAEALEKLHRILDDSAVAAVDLIDSCRVAGGTVLVAGLGKSGLIGRKISATLASLGVPAHTVHPTDAMHGDLGTFRKQDLLLALSFSGESEEVVALAQILKQDGVKIVSISGGDPDRPEIPTGTLARLADVALSIGVVSEASDLALAPTNSTTATLALGDALAIAAAQRAEFTEHDFARTHPGGALGGMLRPIDDVLRFRVGDNLPVVNESETVREALEHTQTIGRRPGALIVIDDKGATAGIFTDGDLRRLITNFPSQLDNPIRDHMTRSPRVLNVSSLVRDALAMVREHRQDEIPIVDDAGKPVGLLDVQDLMAPRVVG